MGDDAYSTSANYVGMKTSFQSGSGDYMIISGTGDGSTYVSAKNGSWVEIRGGGNNSANAIVVPDNNYIQIKTSNLQTTGNIVPVTNNGGGTLGTASFAWSGVHTTGLISSGNVSAGNALMVNNFVITSAKATQWDSAYTYSQTNRLPLTGGTLSGDLTINADIYTSGHIRPTDGTLTIFNNTSGSWGTTNQRGINLGDWYRQPSYGQIFVGAYNFNVSKGGASGGAVTIFDVDQSGNGTFLGGLAINNASLGSHKLVVDNGTSSFNRGNSAGDILDVRGQNASQMKVSTTAFTVTPNATFGGGLNVSGQTIMGSTLKLANTTTAPTNGESLPPALEFIGRGWDSNSGSDLIMGKIHLAGDYGEYGSGATQAWLGFSVQGSGGLGTEPETLIEAIKNTC